MSICASSQQNLMRLSGRAIAQRGIATDHQEVLPPLSVIMNENSVPLEPTEDELFIEKVSDDALEAIASGTREQITFTFSYNIFYCRFC